jgi:hydrogenase-4 component F
MGILAFGVGLGGGAVFGAMLHAVSHSLTKGMLFLLAGNILAAYRTKEAGSVRGLKRALPLTGGLWVAGFFAITGTPPFGLFLSELTILRGALDQGRGAVAALYLLLLAVIFTGMATTVLGMAQGHPSRLSPPAGHRETPSSVAPPLILGVAVLVLGIYIPPVLGAAAHAAAKALGGG